MIRQDHGQRVQGMFDLLVRGEAGQGDQMDAARGNGVPGVLRKLRRGVHPVADDGDPVAVHPEAHQIVRTRRGDGDVRGMPVDPRGEPGLGEPADPGQDRACDRPLVTVTVVGQQHHVRPPGASPPEHAREEGDAVLGVDDDVEPLAQHGQPGARIDGERTTTTDVGHPVPVLHRGGTRVARGAEGDVVTSSRRGRQILRDALEVDLTAAALGMPGIAPAEQ